MTKKEEMYKRKTIITKNIVWFLTSKQYKENIQVFKQTNKLNVSNLKYKSIIQKMENLVKYRDLEITTLKNKIKDSENIIECMIEHQPIETALNEKKIKELETIVECLNLEMNNLETTIENKNSSNENTIVYTHNYTNGDTYEGTALNNNNIHVRHGIGKMTYENGDIYSGFWSNGQRHGKGKLFSKSNKSLTCGVWKNGEFDGIMTTYSFEGQDEPTIMTAYKEEYKNGKPTRSIRYATAREYNMAYTLSHIRNIRSITNGYGENHRWEYEYRYGGPSNQEIPLDLTPQYLYL